MQGHYLTAKTTDAATNAQCLITAAKECGYDGIHPGVDVTIEGEAVIPGVGFVPSEPKPNGTFDQLPDAAAVWL